MWFCPKVITSLFTQLTLVFQLIAVSLSRLPARNYSVLDFGAKGDGYTIDSKAINAAFEACRQSNFGSSVIFPAPYNFLTGPFDASCNHSTILLERGAKITSINSTRNWPLGLDCPEPAQGKTSRQAAPLIMISNAVNMTLTGGGRINANGKMWWSEHCGNWWCPSWVPGVSPEDPYAWRPFMLRIHRSSKIYVQDIDILDPGFWCIVPTFSQSITIRNVNISADPNSPNTDGIEPMWTTDVYVADCNIVNGDDCITIKSGSRNVLVERITCEFSHGLTVGSVWDDDVENVTYRECTLRHTRAGPRIKGRRQGNATISGIRFQNITLVDVDNGLQIDMNYETPGSTKPAPGVIASEITYENIQGSVNEVVASLECLRDRPCTQGLRADTINITAHQRNELVPPQVITKRHASHKNWTCENVKFDMLSDVMPPPDANCFA